MATTDHSEQRLCLASNNQGKVRELQQMLAPYAIEVVPQSEFSISDAVEDGLSFVENAIIKARHACKHSGLPSIADDSGLEVDALDGKPGIYSARFAGDINNDPAFDLLPRAERDALNNAALLNALRGIPDNQRSARFRCVLVHMRHELDPTPSVVIGSWEGTILHQADGNNGFGYDPLFFALDQQCTSASLSAEVKNQVSHRAKAMQQLLSALQLSD